MKIVTWNVNGIRSIYPKSGKKFLNFKHADIFCLQEVKAAPDQFPQDLLKTFKNHYIHSAKKKGYSGVALFCKTKPLNIYLGLGEKKFDDEGRVIIAEFKNFLLFNCYFPNGQRDHARVPYKLEFSHLLLRTVQKMSSKCKKPAIICGDYNTAHQEIDLANPKANRKTTGFLPLERQWLDTFSSYDYIDCFRYLHPEKTGCYTWWTYRGDCRKRNIGWRIDYFFVSKPFIKKITSCFHLPQISGSDHCPVLMEF